MSNLAGNWIGNLYGTNAGNAFMELENSDGKVEGTLRFNDTQAGLTVFKVSGEGEDKLELTLTPTNVPEGAVMPAKATAELQADGGLSGKWETDIGTAGVFKFQRQSLLFPARSIDPLPEQIFYHRAWVGSIRLLRPELERLIQVISQDFTQGQVVVTYLERGVQVTKFAEAFLRNAPNGPLKALKISVQEVEVAGLNKSINIDLVEDGMSLITSSSPNESWVIGKGEMIRSVLKGHENKLVSWYRKYGLTLNNIIFLVLLVVTPGITHLGSRAALVSSVVILLIVLSQIYARLIPNTLIFVSTKQPSWWETAWISVLAWCTGVAASVFAGLIVWYFTKSK